MIVPNQEIEIIWKPANKKWLVSKGYIFTKYNDIVLIKAEDLPLGSHKNIKVQCDYCGEIVEKGFKEYLRGRKVIKKDCCSKCQKLKTAEICKEKYGVSNVFQRPEIKEKIKETNINKYGHENIAHGIIKEKIKENNIKKYGVPYVTQAQEIVEKIRKSLYNSGKVATSKMQMLIYDMITKYYGEEHCKLNYPYDKLNFDCFLNIDNCKIDIEYDGWYWHKDRIKEDNRRNYFLIRRGIKILRIRSIKEIPTITQIKEAVDILLHTNQQLIYIDLDIR